MLTRILLIFIAVISLCWIIFTSYDMLSSENDYNPNYLFSELDDQILVINQSEDISAVLQHCETTGKNGELTSLFNKAFKFQLTLSAKRNHLLINCQEMITPNYLKELFSNSSSLNMKGFNKFTINGYQGRYHKNKCYLSTVEYEGSTINSDEFKVDKNATASLIDFKKGMNEVTDIYLKNGSSIEFKRKTNSDKLGKKVSDEQLFGSIISSRISSYEFNETDYLRASDKVFMNSPMNDWVKTGIVKFEMDGKQAIVSDYREGQNPINVMCEALGIEPQNYESATFKSTPLLSSFDNNTAIYFYLMDDYVVISHDKETCEKIVADYKLGNTISRNAPKRELFFGGLPRKVNYRIVQSGIKESKSIYKNCVLTTKVINGEKVNLVKVDDSMMKSINIGEAIATFQSIDENRMFVQTKSNKLIYIENGTKKWEKSLEGKSIGVPELIDIYSNNNTQLLVATEKKVYVFDVNGNYPVGFPIDLKNSNCSETPIFYTWKGKSSLLVPIEGGQIAQFDTKGIRLSLIKSQLNGFTLQPIVWASSDKPFLGVYDGVTFEMIDLERKRSFRSFKASGVTHYFKIPSEILLLANENGSMVQYNQKGDKSKFGEEEGAEIHSIHNDLKSPTLIAQKGKTLQFYNSRGDKWLSIPLNFESVEEIQMNELENGQILLTIINGIENNVYLYSINGKIWKEKSWEGISKAELFISNTRSFKLITIVDKLIVEYKEIN